MKKKISLLTAFLFCAIISFAQSTSQYPNRAPGVSNDSTLYWIKGATKFSDGSINTNYTDTASANLRHIAFNSGAQIFVNDTIYVRNISATKWIAIGTGTLKNDTVYVKPPLYVYIDSLGHQVIAIQQPDGLISPGIVTWLHDSTFFVTSAQYILNGIYYTSPSDSITLSGIDPSDPVKFLFIVDTSGHATYLRGTPAPIPLDPQVDPASQIALTSGITFNAGATNPANITLITIYDENLGTPTEWAAGHTGTATINYNSTANPFHLTIAGFVSSYVTNSKLTFLSASVDTVTNGQVLFFALYLNGALGAKSFRLQFFNGATASSSNIALVNTFGLNPNDSNAYQIIAIPLSAFTWTSTLFNKLVITNVGTDNSGAKGYYIDYVNLQTGIIPITPPNGNFQDSNHVSNDSLFWCKKGICYYLGKVNGGGGGGSPNTSVGSGYAVAINGTNNIKSLTGGYAMLLDSITTNQVNLTVDSAALHLKFLALKDSVNSITGYTTLYQNSLKQNLIALTTTGTSGSATFNQGTGSLNIPQYSGGSGIPGIFNIGSGFRLVKPTDTVKTLFGGLWTTLDSSSNTNGITVKSDSAGMATYFVKIKDSALLLTKRSQIFPNVNAYNVYPQKSTGGSVTPMEIVNYGTTTSFASADSVLTGLAKYNYALGTFWNVKLDTLSKKYVQPIKAQESMYTEHGAEGISFHVIPAGTDTINNTWNNVFQIRAGGLWNAATLGLPTTGTYTEAYIPYFADYDTSTTSANDTHRWVGGLATANIPFIWLHSNYSKGGSQEYIRLEQNLSSASGGAISFKHSRGTYISKTASSSADIAGYIRFYDYDGSRYQNTASIIGITDASVSDGTAPQSVVIQTSATDSTALATRMRIWSNGGVSIGNQSSAPSAGGLQIDGAFTSSTDVFKITDNTASGGFFKITDLTSVANNFIPLFYGKAVGTISGRTGTYFIAEPGIDDGNSSAFIFDGRLNSAAITADPLVQWTNFGTLKMQLAANGDLQTVGNFSLTTAGSKIKITEGSGGSVGQTTLVAGTKAITISGVSTSTRAIVTLVSQGGTVTTTINYAAVCTSNTLTITALTSAGATDVTDTSVLNYFIVN